MLDPMTKPTKTSADKGKNNARLSELMDEESDLTRHQVGKICGVTKACVDMWLRPRTSDNWRPMPERLLRLLEFELGKRAPKFTPASRAAAK
jgi:hypothetical protein